MRVRPPKTPPKRLGKWETQERIGKAQKHCVKGRGKKKKKKKTDSPNPIKRNRKRLEPVRGLERNESCDGTTPLRRGELQQKATTRPNKGKKKNCQSVTYRKVALRAYLPKNFKEGANEI